MSKQLIQLAERYLGPKVSAVVAGGVTVLGQVESRLAMSDTEATALGVITDAVSSGNVSAILPSLAAAAGAYAMRQASPVVKKGVEVSQDVYLNEVNNIDTSPATFDADMNFDTAYDDTVSLGEEGLLDKSVGGLGTEHIDLGDEPQPEEGELNIDNYHMDENMPYRIEALWEALEKTRNDFGIGQSSLRRTVEELERVVGNKNLVSVNFHEHREQVRTLTNDLKKQIIDGNSRIMGECGKQTLDMIKSNSTKIDERFRDVNVKMESFGHSLESQQYDIRKLQDADKPLVPNRDPATSTITVPKLHNNGDVGTEMKEIALGSQPGLERPLRKLGDGSPNQEVHGEWFGNPHQPLGIRQNNIGNIRPTAQGKTAWRGEIASDTAYAAFVTPQHGIRAMMYLLRKSYFQRRKLDTVQKIIHRWSPYGDPGNSRASVDNYVVAVASALDVAPNKKLRLDYSDDQLITMVKAMAKFENGKSVPYSESTFIEALRLL